MKKKRNQKNRRDFVSLLVFAFCLALFTIFPISALNASDSCTDIEQGHQTIGVTSADNAFDCNPDTYATIPWYWGEGGHHDFLHFVSYVGNDSVFCFNLSVNKSGLGGSIYVDGETTPGVWKKITSVNLNAKKTTLITIYDAQAYKNSDGQISLRARWVGGSNMDDSYIFEIWEVPKLSRGSQTIGVTDAAKAFDGNPQTYARIPWYWGEGGHHDFLHFSSILKGDNIFKFKISVAQSGLGGSIYIDGLIPPSTWDPITSVPIDAPQTAEITISNPQTYKQGQTINLRARWVGGSSMDNAYIYEIWRTD